MPPTQKVLAASRSVKRAAKRAYLTKFPRDTAPPLSPPGLRSAPSRGISRVSWLATRKLAWHRLLSARADAVGDARDEWVVDQPPRFNDGLIIPGEWSWPARTFRPFRRLLDAYLVSYEEALAGELVSERDARLAVGDCLAAGIKFRALPSGKKYTEYV